MRAGLPLLLVAVAIPAVGARAQHTPPRALTDSIRRELLDSLRSRALPRMWNRTPRIWGMTPGMEGLETVVPMPNLYDPAQDHSVPMPNLYDPRRDHSVPMPNPLRRDEGAPPAAPDTIPSRR